METEKENALVARPKQWWLSTREFFRDTNSEMRKVTWPTRNEVVTTTAVVIVATLVFALFLWGCDVVFYKAIDFLFTRFGVST
ncbi:MAG: preprotein translocase subunit SecE [Acidobacteria bacterium]|nr:preprotein translocase subunit SecE [Acidobacteriota bacterium]MBV9474723.1 preprotein translocase subunit SecE [Acidobacteriota bacterium]